MRPHRLRTLACIVCLSVPTGIAVYAAKTVTQSANFTKQISKDERVTQALNRLTFGARPGDADAVRKMGLKKWIDQQLHPNRIPENPEVEARIKTFDTLTMSTADMVRNYPAPQIVRQMVAGQIPFPQDPDRRMMIERLVKRDEQRLAAGGQGQNPQANAGAPPVRPGRGGNRPPNQAANSSGNAAQGDMQGNNMQGEAGQPQTPAPGAPPLPPGAPAAQPLYTLLAQPQIRILRTGTPQERLALFQSLTPEKQDDVIAALPPQIRQVIFAAAPPDVRRKIELSAGPAQVVARDLTEAKVIRAVYSNRQLEEVLADFWFNHFNVFLDKGADRYLITEYDEKVIRPHVLGKFRDLLEATAKSPAMLFYLDNWQSVGPNAPQPRGPNQQRRGLNENYGRELLELHTLGVDGGYSQKDVTEVARCFTGWTINQPQRVGTFQFAPRQHDRGEKTVLGVKIAAGGGIEDGEKVLDIVARHPATAHFISKKLAERFVADDPPPALVERMAQTFLKTDGDIRAVLETMIDSKEFWSEGAFRSKMKSPLEMVVSAVRASGADVDFATGLVNQVAQLGEPLYRKQEPTGYSNTGAEWMNSAGLMARMNFALQLTTNKIPGVVVARADNNAGIELGSPDFQKK